MIYHFRPEVGNVEVKSAFVPSQGSHGCVLTVQKDLSGAGKKYLQSEVEVRVSPGPKLGSFGVDGDLTRSGH